MNRIELTKDDEKHPGNADFLGNNAAFMCPRCGKVFLVNGYVNGSGRDCTGCGESTAYVEPSGGKAWLDWE